MRVHQSWQSRDLAQLFLMLSQQYHVFYLSWNTHQTFILLIESLKCPPYNNSGLPTLSSTPITHSRLLPYLLGGRADAVQCYNFNSDILRTEA
jgi:hypothetical protein